MTDDSPGVGLIFEDVTNPSVSTRDQPRVNLALHSPRISPSPASGFQSALHGLDLIGGGFDDAMGVKAPSDARGALAVIFPSAGSFQHDNHATDAENGFEVIDDTLAKPVGTEGLRLVLVGRGEVQREGEATR